MTSQQNWAFSAWNAEKKTVRYQYWSALRKVSQEYYELVGKPDPDGFGHFLFEQYGVKINLDTGSMITGECTIVDEEKYTIFLLKLM